MVRLFHSEKKPPLPRACGRCFRVELDAERARACASPGCRRVADFVCNAVAFQGNALSIEKPQLSIGGITAQLARPQDRPDQLFRGQGISRSDLPAYKFVSPSRRFFPSGTPPTTPIF